MYLNLIKAFLFPIFLIFNQSYFYDFFFMLGGFLYFMVNILRFTIKKWDIKLNFFKVFFLKFFSIVSIVLGFNSILKQYYFFNPIQELKILFLKIDIYIKKFFMSNCLNNNWTQGDLKLLNYSSNDFYLI